MISSFMNLSIDTFGLCQMPLSPNGADLSVRLTVKLYIPHLQEADHCASKILCMQILEKCLSLLTC